MKILLVDDHKIFRQGLKSCLAEETHYEVVGEADNGQDAIEQFQRLRPDLILMDIAMPGLNGVDAARSLLGPEVSAPAKLIVLSSYSDPEFVTEVLRLGASGYVLKNAAFDELVNAIETVKNGKVYLSPEIAGVIVDVHVRDEGDARGKRSPQNDNLTKREREIVQLLADGFDAKVIAGKLSLSPKTVHAMRNRAMAKLNVHSVAELTKYAIRVGLTTLDE